jgi:hypothetical protein
MLNLNRLISELQSDAPPVKAMPHPVILTLKWVGAAMTYLLVLVLISGTREDLPAQLHQLHFLVEISALFVMFASMALAGSYLAYPDLYQKRWIAYVPAGAVLLFFGTLCSEWLADVRPAPLPKHSFECTISILLCSVLPAAAALFLMRRYSSTHIRWSGAIALLSAFSIGSIWLRLYEPNDSITHVMVWHYLPMVVIWLTGSYLGGRVLKW